MLAGSGGTITAHFTPNLIVIGAAAGIVCGILAMIGPAIRLVRDGPLASMASVGGVQRARTIPLWPLFAGVVMLAAAVVVLKIFERGSLPLNVGINGMTVGLCGVVLVTAWVAPRGAGLLIELLTIARPDSGVCWVPIRRYTLLFASRPRCSPRAPARPSARTACNCSAPSRSPSRNVDSHRLVDLRPVGVRSAGRPGVGRYIRVVTGAAQGGSTSSRSKSTISSGALSRRVIGVTPGDWYSQALYEPADERDRFWQGCETETLASARLPPAGSASAMATPSNCLPSRG